MTLSASKLNFSCNPAPRPQLIATPSSEKSDPAVALTGCTPGAAPAILYHGSIRNHHISDKNNVQILVQEILIFAQFCQPNYALHIEELERAYNKSIGPKLCSFAISKIKIFKFCHINSFYRVLK